MVKIIFFIFIILSQLNCKTKSKLLFSRHLEYPSASAVEYLEGKVYVSGDDASDLLVLNESLEIIDSINLIETAASRVPKDIKPDYESITALGIDSSSFLLLLGSGSFDTIRNKAMLIDTRSKEQEEIRLDVFYDRIKNSGIKELNVEGLSKVGEGFILGNRGNLNYPENFLILTSLAFWEHQATADLQLIKLESDSSPDFFSGISGLAYSSEKDWLLISISSENTTNAYDDGAIGKSYLWIIKKFSERKAEKILKPDTTIDLNELDPAFKGKKIESVCVFRDFVDGLELFLVADDDKGSSWISRVELLD